MYSLLEKYDLLASFPKTKHMNVDNIYYKCTYKTKKDEHNNIITDFSDCKYAKLALKINKTKGMEIFVDYMKEFEQMPKEYMIEQLDNIIFKDGYNDYCYVNGDRISTDNSRSCIIDLTTRKHLFKRK